MTKKLSWQVFDDQIQAIYENYKDAGITKIVGISRGGLIPAVKLSHMLDVPMVSLQWQTRDNQKVKDTEALLQLMDNELETTLFIDDICDTGFTIEDLRTFIPESKWAVMVTKKPHFVDFAALDMTGDDSWVVFPWENQDE
jgi:hypoxanthine phosphoribosyltransferase